MNISIRHLINILNHEGISLREKQEYLKKYQVNTKRRLSIHHRSAHFVETLAEMIQKRLTNDLYIFYEHDEDRLHLDDQEPCHNSQGDTISYANYYDNYSSCISCDSTTYYEDVEHVHGDSYCPSCYRRQCYYCEDCEEINLMMILAVVKMIGIMLMRIQGYYVIVQKLSFNTMVLILHQQ
jgi:hypothetical protein